MGEDEKRETIFFLISLGGTKKGGNWLFILFLVGREKYAGRYVKYAYKLYAYKKRECVLFKVSHERWC